MWTAKSSKHKQGVVLHVTEKGGIKVLRKNGEEEWVPYHHVNHRSYESPDGDISESLKHIHE